MSIDLEQQLVTNLTFHIEKLLLDKGFYFNVASGQLDFNGVDQSRLIRITNDPDFVAGRVYQSQYQNWVYEEDVVSASGLEPILASGVFVNNVFYPRTDATYGHSVDYVNGRIIFDSSMVVASTDAVQAEFGVKNFSVRISDKATIPLVNDLLVSNPASSSQQVAPSGLTLPAILIERVRGTSRGLQLGGGKITHRFLDFYILGRDQADIIPISFCLSELEDKAMTLVDWNQGIYPLDEFGDKTSGYIPFSTQQADASIHFNAAYFLQMESRRFPTAKTPLEIEIVNGQIEIRRPNA
jgi:hypothetical protein